MNARKITWGLFLVTLGSLLILRNFEVINFSFYFRDVFKFWPVILIFIGINALTRSGKLEAFSWVGPVFALICLTLFFTFGIRWDGKGNTGIDRSSEWVWSGKDSNTQHFNLDMDEDTRFASLNFKGGGASFSIGDTSSYLLDADTYTKIGEYRLEKVRNDSMEVINLDLQSNKVEWKNGEWENKVKVKLNPKPVWDLSFSLGAGSAMFDLSQHKIRNLEIEAGATAIDVKIADLVPVTNVKVEAGASSVVIRIPQNAQCTLDLEAVLSSKKIEGFEKRGDNKYQTKNYTGTGNVINISVETGVSSIEIQRY